ncbi:MAG: glycoside hydrolase family 75 protein [Verrucomicrobia bacterium]|nr:glycoside hydrolase family 75 protein [Verrucomicrobiota bacterium]
MRDPQSPAPDSPADRLKGAEFPPPEDEQIYPARWNSQPRRNRFGWISRTIMLLIFLALLLIPISPFATRIKNAIGDWIGRSQKNTVIVKEVPREVIREVIREVPRIEPLPSKFVPRKDVDVASLYNGITIETKVETSEGNFASLELGNADAYKVSFQLQLKVPKPNQTVAELARLNSHLPKMLPHLDKLLENGKVSGFYHKLYENKVGLVQKNLTRLNKLLDRHNFFDCETILELRHPDSKRQALLIQSEMDVVADGSDGDRMSEMSADIYNSDYYQPFTSYEWPKVGTVQNPLLPKWQAKLEGLKKEREGKNVSTARKNELKAQMSHLETEIKALKSRSSLIGEKDPFIVLSLLFKDYPRIMAQAPSIGDYAVVIHGDKIYPAICGDYGPSMKMGEASLKLAKTINEKATPYIRGEDDLKVTYLIFPGTAEKPFGNPNLEKWSEKISTYLKEIGGLGADYALHKWEEPAPVTPPVTPPIPDAPATPAVLPAASGSAKPVGTSSPPAANVRR